MLEVDVFRDMDISIYCKSFPNTVFRCVKIPPQGKKTPFIYFGLPDDGADGKRHIRR
jgi:hypothetical protein